MWTQSTLKLVKIFIQVTGIYYDPLHTPAAQIYLL